MPKNTHPNRDGDRLAALFESDPGAFYAFMDNLKGKVVVPHAGQQVVLDSDARFKVMNCGRRFGKTKLAAKVITQKARSERKILWWCAPTYKIVKRGYAEVLRQLPDGVLTHVPPPESNFDAGRAVILRFKNGSKMEFYSAERPEGMLGEGVDFVVLDEAATMPARIWNQIISPTLMDRLGGALLISTPRGRNWFYRCWQMGQDPLITDWASWTFTSADNPTLPEGEVERMRQQLPRLEYEQEVLAEFLAAGSSVFVLPEGCFQRDAKVLPSGLIENYPPKGYVVLGIDLARTHDFTVLSGARARDRRMCYFERMQAITWPEQKRRIRRAVRTLMKAGAESVMLVIDSTGVGDPIAEDLEVDGYDVVGLNFTTHKNNMVKLLAKDLEERKAFIIENQHEEFENYAMTMTPAGRMTYSAPEGEHDDVVAAKMLCQWGLVNEGIPEIQVVGPDDPVDDQISDPWELDYDEDGFEDLVDDEDQEMTDAEAYEAIGLGEVLRPPTPAELLLRPEVWFKG